MAHCEQYHANNVMHAGDERARVSRTSGLLLSVNQEAWAIADETSNERARQ